MRTRGRIAEAALLATAGLVTGVVLGTWAQQAGAGEPPGTLVVTTTADEVEANGTRSLREAFMLAAANPDANTIELDAGLVYELDRCGGAQEDSNESGDLDLVGPSNLRIVGLASTIEQTCAGERVLHVTGSAELDDVVVTGGDVVGDGGGVRTGGELNLFGSIVQGNAATGAGGGIWSGTDTDLSASTVTRNVAGGAGGGVFAAGGGFLVESAVMGNRADRGGGLATGPSGDVGVVWDLEQSTVSSNEATTFAGGIWTPLGEVEVETTTITDNRSVHPGGAANVDAAQLESEGDALIADPQGSTTSCSIADVVSDGGNVDDGTSCGFDDPLDRSDVAVDVRAPFLVGGLTPVAHPYEGSPLLDTGVCGTSPLPDQRGVTRPQGPGCDVGAVEVEPCGEAFSDVAVDHPFCWEVGWMAAAGISRGYDDDTYRPGPAVSRQAMSAFLLRLSNAGFRAPATPTFTDVPVDHPFFLAIEWMAAAGVSTGYGDGTYRPDAPVTRQAMSAFLQRLAAAPPAPGQAASFSDVGTGHPFAGAIGWMAASGVSTGYDDGTFRPLDAVSRQAMSAFLYRLADGLVVQELRLPV